MDVRDFNLDSINSDNVLKTILRYLASIVNLSDRDEILRLLSNMSRDLVNAERCSLWLLDNERQNIYAKIADGVGELRIPLKSGFAGCAIEYNEPLISNDPYSDERFFMAVDSATGYRTRNLIAVPIANSDGEPIGAFEVLNKIGNCGFDESDLQLLALSVAITGRIMDSFVSQDTLETIFTFATKIADETNLDKLLRLLADLARDILHADRCSLWLVDRERQELWTKTAHGLGSVRIPVHSGFVGNVVKTDAALICNDVDNDSRFYPDVDKMSGYTTRSVIAIPVKTLENDIIGALQCLNKRSKTKAFKQSDVKKLMLVGGYAAQTLEVSGLYKEIEDTQKEVIFTLGTACEFRSRETSNHVKRVAEYSMLLALEYGLEIEDVQLIKQASPMHDIGKIAIPDTILNKTGGLSPEEFEIIKTHSEIGYSMLCFSKRKILKAAAIISIEHHEKWDGTGYPKGLKGEEIHIYGRISALADVFDALGSDRCYKKAWKLDWILELFKAQKGKHFEPKLVDIFFENLPAFLAIEKNYRD